MQLLFLGGRDPLRKTPNSTPHTSLDLCQNMEPGRDVDRAKGLSGEWIEN